MPGVLDIAEAPSVTPADMVAIRDARKWKRSDLARYLGCNYTTVWRMETGKVPIDGAHQRLLQQLNAASVFTFVRTVDGTVIARDPETGISASGSTPDEALAELRRLLAMKAAA